MKNFLIFIYNNLEFYFLLLVLFSFESYSQISYLTVEDACMNSNNGSIHIDLNYDENVYSTPFEANYINDFTNEEIDFTIQGTNNGNVTHLLSGLDIGEFTIIILLNSESQYEICGSVESKISVTSISTVESCNDDGQITISASGGTTPYSYNWNNGSSNKNQTGLGNGFYVVTVTDYLGCSNVQEFEVSSSLGYTYAIQNVCGPGMLDGEIIINHKKGYNYQWDTNPIQTTNMLTNLGEGLYCVTITFPISGCIAKECFNITFKEELALDGIEISKSCPIDESGQYLNDGQIYFNVNDENDQLLYYWDDIGYGGNHRLNLSAGEYYVTVSNNCASISETFLIEPDCFCDHFINPPYNIIHGCGSGNGQIIIYNPLYNYNWSNSSTSYIISNLAIGEYFVTITDPVSGCQSFNSYVVENQEDLSITDIKIEKSCNNINIGNIDFNHSEDHTNNNNIFSYWTDEPDISRVRTRENLYPGTYTFIYETHCNSQEFEFIVEPYELNLFMDANVICEGTSSITAQVTGENPPFSYYWDNESTSQMIGGLSFGETHYVTVTDALGCETFGEYELTFVEELGRSDPCEAVSDGTITLEINNPDNDPITVTYDFTPCNDCLPFPIILNDTSDPIILTIDDLPGNEDLTFYIDNGNGCAYPFTFKLNEEEWDLEYVGHHYYQVGATTIEDAFICEYNKVCHGLSTPVDYPASIALNPYDCVSELKLDCGSVDYLCEGTVIHTKEVDPIWGRAGVAWQIEYSNLGNQLTYPSILDIASDPCRLIRFCPNNPACVSSRGLGEFGGTWNGYYDHGNGCITYYCKGFLNIFSSDFTVCGLEGFPSYISIYNDWEEDDDCDQFEVSLFQVAYNLEEIEAEYGELFRQSELYKIVQDFDGHLHQHFWDPEIYCQKVVVCKNNFNVLTEELPALDCGTLGDNYVEVGGVLWGLYCEPTPYGYDPETDDYDGVMVLCPRDCGEGDEIPYSCVPFDPTFISYSNPFNNDGEKNNNTSYKHQIIYNAYYNTEFEGFGYTNQGNDIFTPNAICKYEEQYFFQTLSNSKRDLVKSENTLFYESDPFNESRILVLDVENSHTTFNIFAEVNNILYVEKPIYCSNGLIIEDFSRLDSLYLLKVKFHGSIYYDNNLIFLSNSANNIAHMIVDKFGNLINAKLTHGSELKNISSNSNHLCYKFNSTSDYCDIDSQVFTGYGAGSYIITSIDENGQFSNNDLISTGGQIELVSYEIRDGSEYFLFNGIGSINYNGVELHNTLSKKNAVVIKLTNGILDWANSFNSEGVINMVSKIYVDNNDQVFVAGNLLESVLVDGIGYKSKGASDIMLVQYSHDGSQSEVNTFGGTGNEVLKDFYGIENVILFGGEIRTNEFSTLIGEIDIANFCPGYNHAILSYYYANILLYKDNDLNNTTSTNEIQEKTYNSIAIVFPNPSNGRFEVKILENVLVNEFVLKVYNQLGVIVYTETVNSNSFTFDLRDTKDGIYMLEIIDKKRNRIHSEMIAKQ